MNERPRRWARRAALVSCLVLTLVWALPLPGFTLLLPLLKPTFLIGLALVWAAGRTGADPFPGFAIAIFLATYALSVAFWALAGWLAGRLADRFGKRV